MSLTHTFKFGFINSNGPYLKYSNLIIKKCEFNTIVLRIKQPNTDKITKTLEFSVNNFNKNINTNTFTINACEPYPSMFLRLNNKNIYTQKHIFECEITFIFGEQVSSYDVETMIDIVTESFCDK